MLDHLTPRKALLLALLIMLLAVAKQCADQIPLLATANLTNPDSYYKLVLLREYTPQTGFQYMARDNAPDGSYLHWSAVHSWTVLMLARGLMACGLGQDTALLWAGGGLTVICVLLLAALVARAIIGQGGRLAAVVSALVLATSAPLWAYGQLIQITHHVFMLVPLAAATCFLLRGGSVSPLQAGRADLAGGLLLGLALWTSPETMPLVVALAAMRAARRLQAPPQEEPCWPVAVGLLAMLAWGWHVDPPPPTFSAWALDHVSLAWLLLATLLAGLLALTDVLTRRAVEWPLSFPALTGATLLAGGIWLFAVPGALAGPQGLIPDEIKGIWWAQIGELQAAGKPHEWLVLMFMPMLAGTFLLYVAWREHSLWLTVLAVTTLAYGALGAWHIRMGAAAAFVTALAYGMALARQHAFSTASVHQLSAREQWRAAALLLLPPLQVGLALGLAALQPAEKKDEAKSGCHLADIAQQLNSLPPGTMLASTNLGPELLWRTHHKVVAGNYHHNVSGIVDVFRVWLSLPPDAQAQDIIARRRIDYVLECGLLPIPPKARNTLLGRVSQGEEISWLPQREQLGAWWLYERVSDGDAGK
ncbi:MAG: hypothetical protein ACN6O3_05810 [Comamonas sp.]